jgi:hypothetical protein
MAGSEIRRKKADLGTPLEIHSDAQIDVVSHRSGLHDKGRMLPMPSHRGWQNM